MESAAKAACYYYNGNFKEASREFSILATSHTANFESPCTGRKRSRFEATLARLPELAYEADAAICKARSALTDSSLQHITIVSLLKESLSANAKYRRALLSVATTEMTKKSRQKGASSSLFAGVSAAWLCLQLQNKSQAFHVTLETIMMAESFLSLNVPSSLEDLKAARERLDFLAQHMSSQLAVRAMSHTIDVLGLKTQRKTSVRLRSREDIDRQGDETIPEKNGAHRKYRLRLRVREQIVRSLCLHQQEMASITFTNSRVCLRDESLKEAVSLEASESCGHFARCVQLRICALEALQAKQKSAPEEEMKALEPMPGLQSSILLWDKVVGCLYATCCGRLDRALETFRRSLMLCENSSVVVPNTSLDVRELLSNLAECLILAGKPSPASELLLFLLRLPPMPPALLPQPRESGFELVPFREDEGVNSLDSSTLQWRLFLASSVESHDVLCTAIAEKLFCESGDSEQTQRGALIAYIFSLLVGEQAELALDLCRKSSLQEGNHAVASLLALFEADAGLTMVMKGTCSLDISRVKNSISSLMDMAKKHYNRLSIDDSMKLWELDTSIQNNSGISLLLQEKMDEASVSFRDAITALDGHRAEDNAQAFLHPFFNLSLLCYKRGEFKDACSVWLKARGFWEISVTHQETVGLGKLQQKLDESIGRLSQLSSPSTDSNSPVFFAYEGIRKNCCIGGIEAFQVVLMDTLMLQSAMILPDGDMQGSR